MVRSVISIFFLWMFFSCKEQEKQITEDLPVVKNDTFDFFDNEDNIPILKGFSVDTIKYFDKRTDYTETLICPKITGKEFSRINEILKKEIKRKIIPDLDSLDNKPVDTSKKVFGVVEDNMLLKMYKNNSLVSYGFLSISIEPGRMRPFRKYFTVNYDTEGGKFIFFDDYFKVSGHADSTLLKSIIYGDVGVPGTDWYTLSDRINFSFDKENVYFYFDMFGEAWNPMGLVKRVKKKYLDNFINNGYK